MVDNGGQRWTQTLATTVDTMSEFLSLWEKKGINKNRHLINTDNQVHAGLQMLVNTANLPSNVVYLPSTSFTTDRPDRCMNILFPSVATSLVSQIAIFVCTYFPAYILCVVPCQKRDNVSTIHFYYVGFRNPELALALPVPPNESRNTMMYLEVYYTFGETLLGGENNHIYMSNLVFVQYCNGCISAIDNLAAYLRSCNKYTDQHFIWDDNRIRQIHAMEARASLLVTESLTEADKTVYTNLRWKLVWKELLLVFRARCGYPIDLIREIGRFL